MGQLRTILGVVLVVKLCLGLGSTLQFDWENLDARQTAAIGELRELVVKRDLGVADYMKEDYHLAKWLAFKDFELEGTFQAIKEDLEWRKREKVDTILEEDWDDMRRRFPFTMDTVDKGGRPVMYIDMHDWDIAGYLSQAGEDNTKRYLRYAIMYSEEAEKRVRTLRAQGKNVTQFSMLSNFAGYSTSKHACIQCLWAYREGCNTLAPHYVPGFHQFTVVNTPLVFRGVFSIFSALVQKNFVIYGQDRHQWEPMLLEILDKDQIPARLLEEVELQDKDNSEGWLPWKFEL